MGDLDFRHKAMGDLSAVAGERSKEKRTEARGPRTVWVQREVWKLEGRTSLCPGSTDSARGGWPPFLRKAGTHPASALSPQPRLQFSP